MIKLYAVTVYGILIASKILNYNVATLTLGPIVLETEMFLI